MVVRGDERHGEGRAGETERGGEGQMQKGDLGKKGEGD